MTAVVKAGVGSCYKRGTGLPTLCPQWEEGRGGCSGCRVQVGQLARASYESR